MVIDPAALALVVLMAGGLGAAFAGILFGIRQVGHRLDELEGIVARRRHTYPTTNGLEDSLAVTIDVLLDEQAHSEYRAARIEQLRRILGEVREGPLAYDSERPADRRPRPNGSKGR
jgi:hypothetical protein